jgi:apolipoprotein N-acyltransferase
MVPAAWPAEGESLPSDAPGVLAARRYVRDALERFWFRPHERPLLAGVMTYEEDFLDEFKPAYNSALLFDAKGRRVATYDKRVCVPGGEYLPWIDSLPGRDRRLDPPLGEGARRLPAALPPRDAPGRDRPRAGRHPRPRRPHDLLRVRLSPRRPRVVRQGADFLINLSNEAWFPDTSEFDQATAMAVFRAAEIRRSVVRCANSGTSGWIDPWGRPHLLESADGSRSGFGGAVVVAPLLAEGTTPYVRWGEWVGVGSWIAVVLLLLLRRGAQAPALAAPK